MWQCACVFASLCVLVPKRDRKIAFSSYPKTFRTQLYVVSHTWLCCYVLFCSVERYTKKKNSKVTSICSFCAMRYIYYMYVDTFSSFTCDVFFGILYNSHCRLIFKLKRMHQMNYAYVSIQ